MSAVTGFSEHVDSFTAGQEAARMLQARDGAPQLLICFASVHHDQAELLRGIRSVLPGVPLLGGSTGASITEDGWRKRAVALLGLQSDRVKWAVGLGRGTDEDAFAAGREAAARVVAALGREPRTLLVFPQAVVGCDHPRFLAGVQAAAPGAYVVGGAAAMDGMLDPSHPLFLRSFEYWDDTVLEHAAPVLGLAWEADEVTDAFAWGHGFLPIGIEAVATRSDGNLVHEIDDMPALEYFRKYLGESFDFRVDAALATLGVEERYEQAGVTAVRLSPAIGLSPDGAVHYIMPITEGQPVKLMRTTRTELIDAARRTAETLQERLHGRKPSLLFMFSCGGRHALLGDRCSEELAQIKAVFGDNVPIVGLQAGGEFTPLAAGRDASHDAPGLHGQWQNYSLILYALAE